MLSRLKKNKLMRTVSLLAYGSVLLLLGCAGAGPTIEVNPEDGSTGVRADISAVTVSFSGHFKHIEPHTITPESVILATTDGAPVESTASFDAGTLTLSIQPTRPLGGNTAYMVVFSDDFAVVGGWPVNRIIGGELGGPAPAELPSPVEVERLAGLSGAELVGQLSNYQYISGFTTGAGLRADTIPIEETLPEGGIDVAPTPPATGGEPTPPAPGGAPPVEEEGVDAAGRLGEGIKVYEGPIAVPVPGAISAPDALPVEEERVDVVEDFVMTVPISSFRLSDFQWIYTGDPDENAGGKSQILSCYDKTEHPTGILTGFVQKFSVEGNILELQGVCGEVSSEGQVSHSGLATELAGSGDPHPRIIRRCDADEGGVGVLDHRVGEWLDNLNMYCANGDEVGHFFDRTNRTEGPPSTDVLAVCPPGKFLFGVLVRYDSQGIRRIDSIGCAKPSWKIGA